MIVYIYLMNKIFGSFLKNFLNRKRGKMADRYHPYAQPEEPEESSSEEDDEEVVFHQNIHHLIHQPIHDPFQEFEPEFLEEVHLTPAMILQRQINMNQAEWYEENHAIRPPPAA